MKPADILCVKEKNTVQFQGAVVSKEGVVFAIVVVKQHVVENDSRAKMALSVFQKFFGKTPVLLMALDAEGEPHWYGMPELRRLTERAALESIKWRIYTMPTVDA